MLFTESETNNRRLFNAPNGSPYVKDGINDFIVHRNQEAVNPRQVGTKSAFRYSLQIPSGHQRTLHLRLTTQPGLTEPFKGALTAYLNIDGKRPTCSIGE